MRPVVRLGHAVHDPLLAPGATLNSSCSSKSPYSSTVTMSPPPPPEATFSAPVLDRPSLVGEGVLLEAAPVLGRGPVKRTVQPCDAGDGGCGCGRLALPVAGPSEVSLARVPLPGSARERQAPRRRSTNADKVGRDTEGCCSSCRHRTRTPRRPRGSSPLCDQRPGGRDQRRAPPIVRHRRDRPAVIQVHRKVLLILGTRRSARPHLPRGRPIHAEPDPVPLGPDLRMPCQSCSSDSAESSMPLQRARSNRSRSSTVE